ncbi:NuA3 HAT complex component NTO1 [Zea mays]|uniref:NuA3 HAT complex component NTO1 n=1 Tax=Zea mays TaxID=4577 RepID=A0A3L6FKQ8_MAIZE|nr:NuA3 HAT complex component NTO1 [Zea mays]
MEIAKNSIASGRVRDLPPSKRFRHVGSHLGSTPSVPLPAKKRMLPSHTPEEAAVALCLPVKKRVIAAPRVEVAGATFCLPAKKRAIVPSPPEDAAPACLPAKKRACAAPADAAVPACVPAQECPCAPLPPPPPVVVSWARVSTKKRVHAPAPRGHAAGSVPARRPANGLSCAEPLVDTVASASVWAKKRAHSPTRREDAARSTPVCLPVNKRVMPPFVPPPSVQSDGARLVAAKEAWPQGSSKHGDGGAVSSRVASGAEERARGKEFKKPEKPVNHKGTKEQVPMEPRCPPREGKRLEKSCEIVDGEQSEAVVEALRKSDGAAEAKGAPLKEEPRNGADEVAAQEPVDVEDDDDDGVRCAVCASTDGDPSDPIVFCDGCDLMVHASCYGNPLARAIPDGDWFCSPCVAGRGKPAAARRRSCCLCPAGGGAMKRTTEGKWAHISCALLVPEVFFRDPDGRDGIDCSRVPAHRFARGCYVCGGNNNGCALECSQPKCGLGFHVSCGLGAGLCIEYQEGKGGGGAIVAGFCREHTELWEKQQLTGKYKIVARGQE